MSPSTVRREIMAASISNLVTATATDSGVTVHLGSYGEDGVYFPAQEIFIAARDIVYLSAFIESLPKAWRQ